MKQIRMVDLHGQYLRIKTQIDSALQEVIESTAFIRGKEVGLFQEELAGYLDVPHAIACGNGTDALQVAMMALGLQPGDEIITTPFTFISTIEVIRLLRLNPVLVDVEEDTFNLDPALLGKVLSGRTRAIVPVHLFGQCANMEKIMAFARQHGLKVIEDNAQAIGASFRFSTGESMKAGTIGHIGTTSFFPSKNLGAFGDGGAIFTRDETLAALLRSLVNHGMGERYHYNHVGVNSRLDTLQAALLRVKLRYLEEYHSARRKAAAYYDYALGSIQGLQVPVRSSFSTHVFHQYTLRLNEGRNELKKHLAARQIPSMIYYPLPLHLQKAYEDLGYDKGDFPVAETLSKQVLSLPMHTELEEEQQAFICEQIINFYN